MVPGLSESKIMRRLRAEGSFPVALLLVVLLVSPGAAWAIKWPSSCPSSVPKLVDAGNRILASAPFVHPGHRIGLFLREGEALTDGFSVDPEGNTIEIVFRPLGGDPIALSPFTATAESASVLYFTFPDTRASLGRVVAGPMDVTIRSGGPTWLANKLVALPPGNDVFTMLEHGIDSTALGAVDASRRLWIPLEFAGFAPGMPMPSCPVELTQKTAFAVRLKPNPDNIDDVIPHGSLNNLRKGKLYFGDFLLNGINVYGEETAGKLKLREFRRGSVIVCGMNDALSLVLMVRLKEAALGPRSTVLPVVKDGSPLPIELTNISAEPAVANHLRVVTQDSFGNRCAVPADSD